MRKTETSNKKTGLSSPKAKAKRPLKSKTAGHDKACCPPSNKKEKAKRGAPRKKSLKRKIKTFKPGTGFLTASLILISAALIFPFILRYNSDSGAKVPQGIYKYGVDISHNNSGPIIWDSLRVLIGKDGRTVRKLKAAKTILPVYFVFIKATEGESFKDRDFKKNWEEAGKRKFSRGAYHFFRSSKDPLLQAENFIKTVGELRIKDLPPVLDIETIHRGCSKKELNEKASLWLKTIESKYGKKPVIYTSARFASDILSKEISSSYPLWIAHYGVESPERKDWLYWQFTDKAVVHGIPGLVDLNVSRPEYINTKGSL